MNTTYEHTKRLAQQTITTLRLTIALLLMLTLGSTSVWGQTDYSGVYYIADDNTSKNHPGKVYSSASDTEKYYLVPASNPQQTSAIDAYYSPNHSTTNGDSEKPFLTTALTNKDLNSIWIVMESGESGYYFIIHALTGKYVIYEVPLPNDPNTNTDGNETKNGKRKTNFVGMGENEVCHVRPHGKNAADTYKLPVPDKLTGATSYTKHCFWINNLYIKKIFKEFI
jgi:hypothetical protein